VETKEEILRLAEPILRDRGLELVDVEFRREAHGQVVRLLVDAPGGVDVEALSDLSREVSDHLDVADVVGGPFTLEVSSPGINRPLTRPQHFVQYRGKKVRIRTVEPIDGQRNFVGRLLAVETGAVRLANEAAADAEVTIPFTKVEKANYEHEFSAADFGKRGADTAERRGGRFRPRP
jgi:ribosome maturation factor RimP